MRIEVGVSTREDEGRRFVAREHDGLDFHLFAVQIALTGYPVTLRLRDRTFIAQGRTELEQKLAELLQDPEVGAVLEHVAQQAS